MKVFIVFANQILASPADQNTMCPRVTNVPAHAVRPAIAKGMASPPCCARELFAKGTKSQRLIKRSFVEWLRKMKT